MNQPTAKPTFSDSWHRVAELRIRLQPAIDLVRQHYRGERWYILRNQFNAEFFRLTPQACAFLLRLEGRTVEEAWQQTLARDPEECPTQDEVIQLLAQLHRGNLLQTSLPANTRELFSRHEERRAQTWRSRLLNLFSIQIPLWDPSNFLTRGLPFVRPLFSRAGAVVWCVVIAMGLKVAADHWKTLLVQRDGVLAPSNLFLLYLALFAIKAVHELGHAFACRRFGGEVHKLGLLILYLSPVPFVDATSSWAFRSKWERIFVASAGMLVELFVAALALFLWAATAPGVVHSLAYNVIFVASVTTVLFNANPLLRYDGYYIASDLLEIPNLAARATDYLRYLAERYLFAVPLPSPAQGRRERLLLVGYGVVSWAYRIVLFSGITVFLAKRYLILGLLMAAGCAFSWTVRPAWRLTRYLQKAPSLARHRPRTVAVVAGGFALVLLLLGVVPFPRHFRAPGIVEAATWSEVHAGSAGFVEMVLLHSGAEVRAGQPLLVLRNPELEFDLEAATAELRGGQASLERSRSRATDEIPAWEERLAALQKRLARLHELSDALVVRAPQDGIWAGLETERLAGSWLARGAPAGRVLARDSFEFIAVVPQSEAASLFTPGLAHSEVRLRGEEEVVRPLTERRIVPITHEHLPSAALGWRAGGEVALSASDRQGVQAAAPFFEVRGRLASGAELRHGRSGSIRFRLPSQPLLWQWERRLRQLFQKDFAT